MPHRVSTQGPGRGAVPRPRPLVPLSPRPLVPSSPQASSPRPLTLLVPSKHLAPPPLGAASQRRRPARDRPPRRRSLPSPYATPPAMIPSAAVQLVNALPLTPPPAAASASIRSSRPLPRPRRRDTAVRRAWPLGRRLALRPPFCELRGEALRGRRRRHLGVARRRSASRSVHPHPPPAVTSLAATRHPPPRHGSLRPPPPPPPADRGPLRQPPRPPRRGTAVCRAPSALSRAPRRGLLRRAPRRSARRAPSALRRYLLFARVGG